MRFIIYTVVNFFMQKLCFRDFTWSFHRQCFWLFNLDLTNDVYSFSTRRMTYVCSRCIERRDSFSIIRAMYFCCNDSDDRISLNWKRFVNSKTIQKIAFHQIANDSSNLTKTICKFRWNDVSLNLEKKNFIKFDEYVFIVWLKI